MGLPVTRKTFQARCLLLCTLAAASSMSGAGVARAQAQRGRAAVHGPGAPVTSSTFVQLARRVGPSVVSLAAIKDLQHDEGARQLVREQGTGVIISADGYVLTNNHVVTGAEEIHAHLQDERERVAQVV